METLKENKTDQSGNSILDDKFREYYLERFRNVASSTSNWGLLFFAAVVYSWVVSIQPKSEFIESYITAKNQQKYFDTLISKTTRKKIQSIKKLQDSIQIINQRIREEIHLTNRLQLDSIRLRFDSILAKIKLTKSKRSQLKQSLLTATSSERFMKDSLMEFIKKNYYPADVLIARTELQRDKVEKYKDSLFNKTKIVFNVPSIESINLGFKKGLIFWMFLALALLIYFFSTRLKLLHYFKEIYQRSKKDGTTLSSFGVLDMQVPFWFAPIQFLKEDKKSEYKNLVGWKNVYLQNILCILLLLLIFSLQISVAWISWQVNSKENFDENFFFKSLTIVLLSTSLLLILLWMQPISFSSKFTAKDHFSVKRREYLKIAISGAFFLFLIPIIGRSLPVSQGIKFKFRRVREKKTCHPKATVNDGFYVNQRNGANVLHRYLNGSTLSSRTMTAVQMKEFEKRLKKITFSDVITKATLHYRIPYWQFVLERESLLCIRKGKFLFAIEIVLYALRYSRNYKGLKIENTQTRLANLLCGLVARFRYIISDQQHKEIKEKVNKIIEIESSFFNNNSVFKNKFNMLTEPDIYFEKKWKKPKDLPWNLPGLVF